MAIENIVRCDEALVDRAFDEPNEVGAELLHRMAIFKDAIFHSEPTIDQIAYPRVRTDKSISIHGLLMATDTTDLYPTDILLMRPNTLRRTWARLVHRTGALATAYIEIQTP